MQVGLQGFGRYVTVGRIFINIENSIAKLKTYLAPKLLCVINFLYRA